MEVKKYDYRELSLFRNFIGLIIYLASIIIGTSYIFGGFSRLLNTINNFGNVEILGFIIGVLVLLPWFFISKFIYRKINIEIINDKLYIKNKERLINTIQFSEIYVMITNHNQLGTFFLFDKKGAVLWSIKINKIIDKRPLFFDDIITSINTEKQFEVSFQKKVLHNTDYLSYTYKRNDFSGKIQANHYKLKFIATIFAFMILFGLGVMFWVYFKINSFQADKDKTNQLAPKIKELFSWENKAEFPYQKGTTNWGTNYIVVSNYGVELPITYRNEWNEALGTDKNIPGNTIIGIVIVAEQSINLGEYKNSANTKIQDAEQPFYVIHYFDIQKKVVVARDTLMGEVPPENISNSGSGRGNLPSDEILLASIKKHF